MQMFTGELRMKEVHAQSIENGMISIGLCGSNMPHREKPVLAPARIEASSLRDFRINVLKRFKIELVKRSS